MLERAVLSPPYPRQMEDHFNRLYDELQLARGWAADRGTWEARRPVVREKLIEALGGVPERTPLNPRVTGCLQRDGYRIELVGIESRPGWWVTGALYLPDLPHPCPAVFNPHGHWAHGRFDEQLQTRCANFARRGYVALIVDMVGYNDRLQQDHRSRENFLTGQTVQGLQVWDNMRAIDYLLSRPEVDATRLGCTGCSGGGNQTMYLSALEERITASVPVCSVELLECYVHKLFCTCETVPGLARFADFVDVCGLIAPRPLMLVHGYLDLGFRLDSARKNRARVQLIYNALGAGDRLDHFVSYDNHAYNREMREAVYGWFDRWLKGAEPPYAPEVEVPIESHDDLRVFPDGLPAGHVTLSLMAAARTRELPPRPALTTPPAWALEAARLRGAVAELFSGWPAVTPLETRVAKADSESIGGVATVVEALYFHSEPDVLVPAVLYKPALAAGRVEAVVRFGSEGRHDVPEEAVAADLAAGRMVLCLDLRGTGETRAEGQSDWQMYLSSVTLGRHYAAMRAWDVRRAVDYLLAREDVATVALGVSGGFLTGLTGLLAAACDPRLGRVEIAQLLHSYRGQPGFGELNQAGELSIVPNLLRVADVEDLLALVAPREVTVGQFVNGLGEPVGVAAAGLRCTAVYALLEAAHALQLPS